MAVPAFEFGNPRVEPFNFFDRNQVSFTQEFSDSDLVGVHANRLITVSETALAVAEANGRILLAAASSVSWPEELSRAVWTVKI